MRKLAGFVFIFTFVFMNLFLNYSTASEADCEDGAWRCSDDAYTLMRCEKGAWKKVECMRSEGKLCEKGACVDPWRYGEPQWPRTSTDTLATPQTLAEKAKYFEDMAARLHVHPKLKFISGVILPCKPVKCDEGQKEPCQDCTESSVPEDKATWKDVEKWTSNENDGLWSGLYLAAEAYRYAVTRDPHVLDILKVLLDGEVIRMKITGVPGIFTRRYIAPGINGMKCPDKKEYYARSPFSDLNLWVKIDDYGCAQYVDGKTNEWVSSKHCGMKEFAGWCWVDNVSKDEYSGHIFLLGVVAKLVDDPQVQATVKGLLSQVAKHLMQNKMEFVDWDGTVTPFGKIHAMAMDDYAGFNAAMALDFIKVAAEVTKDPEIQDWYDNCLLQKKGRRNCLGSVFEQPKAYTKYLKDNGLYIGKDACQMNYNNNAMHMLSMHNLIWYEHDPELREIYQKTLDEDVFRVKGQPRSLMYHHNAFFDFIFAASKKLGPGSDGPAYDAVADGINMLREMPPHKHYEDVQCPPEKCKPYCESRFDEPLGQFARTMGERCPDGFVWWDDPYALISCKKNRRVIYEPTDYLLVYWMGRYYGFIAPDL